MGARALLFRVREVGRDGAVVPSQANSDTEPCQAFGISYFPVQVYVLLVGVDLWGLSRSWDVDDVPGQAYLIVRAEASWARLPGPGECRGAFVATFPKNTFWSG